MKTRSEYFGSEEAEALDAEMGEYFGRRIEILEKVQYVGEGEDPAMTMNTKDLETNPIYKSSHSPLLANRIRKISGLEPLILIAEDAETPPAHVIPVNYIQVTSEEYDRMFDVNTHKL